jgi:hypothetical protein
MKARPSAQEFHARFGDSADCIGTEPECLRPPTSADLTYCVGCPCLVVRYNGPRASLTPLGRRWVLTLKGVTPRVAWFAWGWSICSWQAIPMGNRKGSCFATESLWRKAVPSPAAVEHKWSRSPQRFR